MRLSMKMKIGTFLIAAAVMVSAESYEQRLADSTTVLREMSHASDKGIPQDFLSGRLAGTRETRTKIIFCAHRRFGHAGSRIASVLPTTQTIDG